MTITTNYDPKRHMQILDRQINDIMKLLKYGRVMTTFEGEFQKARLDKYQELYVEAYAKLHNK